MRLELREVRGTSSQNHNKPNGSLTEYISAYETLISHISVGRRAFFDERFQEMRVDAVDLVHLAAFFVE